MTDARSHEDAFDPAWVRRPPLPRCPDREASTAAGRVVLVTGAGGSIGAPLCMRLLDADVAALVALEASESHLHALLRNLERHPKAARVAPVLGDLRDAGSVAAVLRRHAPDVVFHAAAFKHVALLETQPLAAIANNALATWQLLRLAGDQRCARVVHVSTDKAAAPRSIMGASKRLAELAILGWDRPATSATAVRLGNVWGSRGSVVPQLQAQRARGETLEVTDAEARRYFLSHSEAVNVIMAALWLGTGSDVLVPELGAALSVREVVRRVAGSAPFRVSGLRPGERREETLFGPADVVVPTQAPWLRRVVAPRPAPEFLGAQFADLGTLVARQEAQAAVEALWRALSALERGGVRAT